MYQEPPRPVSSSPEPDYGGPENAEATGHGKTLAGAPGCCKILADGITDCKACLDGVFSSKLEKWTPKDRSLAASLLRVVEGAGASGVRRQILLVSNASLVFEGSFDIKQGAGHSPGRVFAGPLPIDCSPTIYISDSTGVFRRLYLTRSRVGVVDWPLDSDSLG